MGKQFNVVGQCIRLHLSVGESAHNMSLDREKKLFESSKLENCKRLLACINKIKKDDLVGSLPYLEVSQYLEAYEISQRLHPNQSRSLK